MNYPGTDLKFRITTEMPGFDLLEDAFEITVRDRCGRTVARISKDDCFYDDQGRSYFTLCKVRSGWYYASFVGYRDDEDFASQQAVFTDSQLLCVVGYCEKRAPRIHDCDKGHHRVCYEQVWSVDVSGADYLADCDGRYIYTADGKKIQFVKEIPEDTRNMGKVRMAMSGEEFLRQWESRTPNGKVDTVPELYDAMNGIPDDKTVVDEIEDEVDRNTPERVTPEDLANFEV